MAREGKAKVLTPDEFKRVLTVAKNSSYEVRNVAMLYCSFGLGLRAKEIASLTIGDIVDSDFNLLEEANLKRKMTKGEKQRHIYLTNKKVRTALQEHIDMLKGLPLSKPLFETQRQSKFTPNILQKWFKSLYDKAGLTGCSSHSGRRTHITRLIEDGVDIEVRPGFVWDLATSLVTQ